LLLLLKQRELLFVVLDDNIVNYCSSSYNNVLFYYALVEMLNAKHVINIISQIVHIEIYLAFFVIFDLRVFPVVSWLSIL